MACVAKASLAQPSEAIERTGYGTKQIQNLFICLSYVFFFFCSNRFLASVRWFFAIVFFTIDFVTNIQILISTPKAKKLLFNMIFNFQFIFS